jgi:hypothetical protein
MPVFTVMAEAAEGQPFHLYNEAVKVAAHAVTTFERFQARGLRNIRIYEETEEISLPQLLKAVADETTAHRSP